MPNPVHNDDPARRTETDWSAIVSFILIALFAYVTMGAWLQ